MKVVILCALLLSVSNAQSQSLYLPTFVEVDVNPPVDTNVYDIILAVGQSNCNGYGEPIAAQDSGSTAWLWNGLSWEVADGALNRYSTIGSAHALSMVNRFGKLMAVDTMFTNHNRRIGLVVQARDGMNIQSFVVQGGNTVDVENGYMMISIRRAKQARATNPNNRIIAVLWHQGEQNSADSQYWLPLFNYIRMFVDTALGTDIPILVGGLNKANPNFNTINGILPQVEDTTYRWANQGNCCTTIACPLDTTNLPYMHDNYYVNSDSLTTVDVFHFDAPGQRIFGLRYYNRFKQTQ